MSQLDELKKYTTVVADTGDIESIKKFAPQDATTNPSLVLKAAQLPQYQPLIADAIGKARRQGGSAETQLINACDQVAVDAPCARAYLHRSGCPLCLGSRDVRREGAQAHPVI